MNSKSKIREKEEKTTDQEEERTELEIEKKKKMEEQEDEEEYREEVKAGIIEESGDSEEAAHMQRRVDTDEEADLGHSPNADSIERTED